MSKYFPIIFFIVVHISAGGQTLNYREIFADDWLKAEAFEQENRHWMTSMSEENNIPYNTTLAVIFPELIRYSALRDKMETTLLKTLYVNLGDEYANFSIGRFQIKPAFAEFLREEAAKLPGDSTHIRFSIADEYDNITSYRKSIVSDLEDPRQSFRYLIVFMKICEKKYYTARLDEETKIKFLASAYNSGIDHTYEEILKISDSRYFTTKLLTSEKYSYSDVSLYWYRMKTRSSFSSSYSFTQE